MKQCPNCGALHADEITTCPCGTDLTQLPPLPAQPAPPPPPVPQFIGRPMGSPVWRPLPQREYGWADILTILGFTSAVAGYFWAGVLLLPIGLIASLIGFCGNSRRALAVAGIVVAAVGIVLKIMMMLDEAGFLPYWVASGVFFS